MCRIKNAKVGVIVIDLEGILEVSEYKMFYARESRNSKGLGFFFRAFAPLSYDFQNDLSIANLTCLNTGSPLCFQREILISEGHIGCLGGALFALPGSPQVICSHTAYSAWIPAGSYRFFWPYYSQFCNSVMVLSPGPHCHTRQSLFLEVPSSPRYQLSSSEAFLCCFVLFCFKPCGLYFTS